MHAHMLRENLCSVADNVTLCWAQISVTKDDGRVAYHEEKKY